MSARFGSLSQSGEVMLSANFSLDVTMYPHTWIRRTLLLTLLLCLAGGAVADSGSATDEAFGLLLAMPGAQPVKNGWIIPNDAAADEADLIAKWRRLKKEGADINAIRHRGTLLAHAIRTGKDQAALWLLRNGADPRKALFNERVDAHQLAKQYERSVVVKSLEAQYGFKPSSSTAAAATTSNAHALAAPTEPQSRVSQAAAELRRLTGPVLQPSDAAQQEWRRYARTLSPTEFQTLFRDGNDLEYLVTLTRGLDGALDEALGRLPPELVRAKAQLIADMLAEWSYVTYDAEPQRITYTGASRAWPALWKRIDKPLNYEKRPDLAGRIPPALWPGLFASGYPVHEAQATGCLLAAVDLPALQAFWPDFQRYFADARDEAPGLVLTAWRLGRESSPCYYGSTQAETAAKLAWLRAQGMTQPVQGLVKPRADDMPQPALARMLEAYQPATRAQPRLVFVPPSCDLVLGEPWLNALVRANTVGWGVPAENVRIVDVPGSKACGLMVSGDSFPDWPLLTDSFAEGPFRDPPIPRCADMPDDGEVWTLERGTVKRVNTGQDTRGTGFASLYQLRDLQTGKRYWLDAGQTGAACSVTYQLPSAYEWQTDAKGHKLVVSRDDALLTRLLHQQCERSSEDGNVSCVDNGTPAQTVDKSKPVLQRLREGATVPRVQLIDAVGTERRAAYRAALAAHDHAQLLSLRASGMPPHWTAAEIAALATADLPLPERRRRIALLFADADQLAGALQATSYNLPQALNWLPRQDWGPILRIIGQSPDTWHDVAVRLRAAAPEDVACDIDHALGYLCGGGVNLE